MAQWLENRQYRSQWHLLYVISINSTRNFQKQIFSSEKNVNGIVLEKMTKNTDTVQYRTEKRFTQLRLRVECRRRNVICECWFSVKWPLLLNVCAPTQILQQQQQQVLKDERLATHKPCASHRLWYTISVFVCLCHKCIQMHQKHS